MPQVLKGFLHHGFRLWLNHRTVLAAVVVLLAMEMYLAIFPAFTTELAAVDIFNYVEEPIRVKCDTEVQILEKGQRMGWRFTLRTLGTTNYTCSFRRGARAAEFAVRVGSGLFGETCGKALLHAVCVACHRGCLLQRRTQ